MSSVYESEPVGYADQPTFWNMVARLRTVLSPDGLLNTLIEIEEGMGRQRTFRNAPRIIDLDILLYDDVACSDPGLTLPHPRMAERAFVLRPLVELAPDLVDPKTRRRFADILEEDGFESVEILGRLETVQ